MLTASPSVQIDVTTLLAPRPLLHALVLAACAGRAQVGAEVLSDLLVPFGIPDRIGVRDAVAAALPEAIDELVVADLVSRTWAEPGGLVYGVAEPVMARLIAAGVTTALVAAGFEEPPVEAQPLPRMRLLPKLASAGLAGLAEAFTAGGRRLKETRRRFAQGWR